MPASTISAAPALPPISSSPSLSPDITPLFPSPGGSELAPSDSSLPTIPSTLSPPNPDALVAPGPFMPFQPSASFSFHSAIPLASVFSAILVFGSDKSSQIHFSMNGSYFVKGNGDHIPQRINHVKELC
ncbi:hypothetical protein MTR67_029652 [Solanum verrucosum]|uniref:Uncharacterized protein n=1 Tax=Solanum verrucosum TaxID=315347 RepID=A0AAF0R4N8_SOLVR|nr:hypothetical protein MTR67_029652 [Solanum verrucosum]